MLICDFRNFPQCLELVFTSGYICGIRYAHRISFLRMRCGFFLKYFCCLCNESCTQRCLCLLIVHSCLPPKLFMTFILYANVFLTKSSTYKYIIDGNTPSASAGKLTNALPPRLLQNMKKTYFSNPLLCIELVLIDE